MDRCNLETNECENSDISDQCDDNDLCTVDSCDAVVGCTNTPIPNCCGDGICGTEETCSSCPQDCCTFESLSIPEEGPAYSGIGGFFFDVTAVGTQDIAIGSFTVRPGNSDGTFRVMALNPSYSPTSNHWKRPDDEAKWSTLTSGFLPGANFDDNFSHELVFDSNVVIPAGTTRGFAIEAPGYNLKGKPHLGLEWQLHVSNSNVALTHSQAVPSLFSNSLRYLLLA